MRLLSLSQSDSHNIKEKSRFAKPYKLFAAYKVFLWLMTFAFARDFVRNSPCKAMLTTPS
ncbi:hypothetical protein JCM18903_32 [Psychrobacter sp. JCM 18903]|nr:hypothetical protein JCM18903_32 [Psychrobacter sp. JCM 18903]